jgi:cell fate regulator YaaT (PSP1 superfamily)
MESVIGVRFQEAGKIYYFSPVGFEDVEEGEYVVVETSRGLEVARVVVSPHQVVLAELTEPLKPIMRRATEEDIERSERLKAKAAEDVVVVRRLVQQRDLPMKVIHASYNLEGNRLTVFFTSEGRVDFRDLLRDLAQELHVQVQLRQVGPRDQAKAVGGYGRCGRRLCCTSWLTTFPAISIKMAKEQNLPLNPSKISGMCGRLLCCLAYEDDTYKQLKAQLPKPGTLVSTPSGNAKVLAVNALRQAVTLQMETFAVVELPAAALQMDRGVVRVVALPPGEVERTEPPASAGNGRPVPPAHHPPPRNEQPTASFRPPKPEQRAERHPLAVPPSPPDGQRAHPQRPPQPQGRREPPASRLHTQPAAARPEPEPRAQPQAQLPRAGSAEPQRQPAADGTKRKRRRRKKG